MSSQSKPTNESSLSSRKIPFIASDSRWNEWYEVGASQKRSLSPSLEQCPGTSDPPSRPLLRKEPISVAIPVLSRVSPAQEEDERSGPSKASSVSRGVAYGRHMTPPNWPLAPSDPSPGIPSSTSPTSVIERIKAFSRPSTQSLVSAVRTERSSRTYSGISICPSLIMELDRSENTNRVHPLSAFSSSSEDSTEEANFLPIQTIPTDFVSLINVTKLGSVSSDKAMPNSAPSGSTTHTATHQGGNTDKKEIYGNSQSSIQSPSSEIDIRQNIYVNGESYAIYLDGAKLPLKVLLTPKTHYKGFAVHDHGKYKPYGGIPTQDEIDRLYSVLPLMRFTGEPDGRALHKIQAVRRSPNQEIEDDDHYFFVYNETHEGFVKVETTCPNALAASRGMQDFKWPEGAQSEGATNRRTHSAGCGSGAQLSPKGQHCLQSLSTEPRGPSRKRDPRITVGVKKLVKPPTSPVISEPGSSLNQPEAVSEEEGSLTQTSPTGIQEKVEKEAEADGEGDAHDDETSWLHIRKHNPKLPIPRIPTSLTFNDDLNDLSRPRTLTSSPLCPRFLPKGSNKHFLSPPVTIQPTVQPTQPPIIPSAPHALNQIAPFNNQILQAHPPQPPRKSSEIKERPQLTLCICKGISAQIRYVRTHIVRSRDFDDEALFIKIRNEYKGLCGFWRRAFGLKGLKRLAVIEFEQSHPHEKFSHCRRLSELDIFFVESEKFMEHLNSPQKARGRREWVDWLGKAGLLSSLEKHQSGNVENNKEGQRKFTYALEFVDGWIAGRIALVGVLPILLAIIAAVAWHMGGPQREGGGAGAFELGILVIVGGYGLVGILAVLSL